jgi:hypothetical protein
MSAGIVRQIEEEQVSLAGHELNIVRQDLEGLSKLQRGSVGVAEDGLGLPITRMERQGPYETDCQQDRYHRGRRDPSYCLG